MNFSDIWIRFSMKFYYENHILDIFFELVNVSAPKIKAKNTKTAKFFKCELTWEIEKSI